MENNYLPTKNNMRIIFMGTPEFAVASLDILIKNHYNVVAVITVPDKPAGRGRQINESDVKKYAKEHQLKILQPEKLKNEDFINELQALQPDLGIVVAFRMLPEIVWNMPRLGTFNLHASLLPQYRGAAPINWAIINGEKETGVSTFFLQHEIDTGNILFQEKTKIGENETAGALHDKLMLIGADLVLKTVQSIEANNYSLTNQTALASNLNILKSAPKIFKENCKINWNLPVNKIHDFIRGLSPYPAAWTTFNAADGKPHIAKIFSATVEQKPHNLIVGKVVSDNKTYLKIVAQDGFINIQTLQLAGRNKMSVQELLRGFKMQVDF